MPRRDGGHLSFAQLATYRVVMTSLERRKSTLSKLDDGILIAVVVVGAIVALSVVGLVVHALFFLVKIAVIGLILGLVVRAVNRR